MPMASENAILDAAAIKRKARMGAGVVEREDASPIINDHDRGMAAMQHDPTLGPQLGETVAQILRSAYPSMQFSVRGEAAVDRQPDADHEARGRAAKPQHSGSDLLGSPEAAD
jgi:hypothetical protein